MRIGGRHGQITIFIIVGLLLVFIFYFVIKTTSDVQKNALSDAQETIFNKLFKKESLRLYRDDCLQDSLSDALILLGKQGGKLWAGDPGGTQGFQETKNGIKYATPDGEFRVLYGITREKNALTECDPGPCPDPYPCDTSTPTCTYTFPDTTVGFGNRPLLTKQIIEGEISSYLKAKVPECMQRIINTEINPSIRISDSTEDLTLQTLITDEGIKVEGEYPITMTLAGEEYFEISKIDLVYPTQLNKLLRTAITNPLKYDQKYIEFSFSQETLQNEEFPFASKEEDDALKPCDPVDLTSYFTCFRALFQDDFQNLEISLESIESENGDDIFIIRTPINNIVNNPEDAGAAGDMFEFYIARQNRPPALDYISRNACPGVYDYLVIPGSTDLGSDGTELRKVEITLNAKDPDEDIAGQEEVKYFNGLTEIPGDNGNYKLELPEAPDALVIVTKDKHDLFDRQDVKFFVDDELTSSFEVRNIIDGPGGASSDPIIISKEDPFWVLVTSPAPNPEKRDIAQTASVSLIQDDVTIPLRESITLPDGSSTKPFGIPEPDDGGDGAIVTHYDGMIGQEIVDKFVQFSPGIAKVAISYQATYCPGKPGEHTQITTSTVDVEIAECISYNNPERPFPSPYHNYKQEAEKVFLDNIGTTSPYKATHVCCDNNNNLIPEAQKQECFRNPEKGCYGLFLEIDQDPALVLIRPFETPNLNRGYLALHEFARCTGKSGNTCGTPLYEFKLDGEDKILCGKSGEYGCAHIPADCADGPAFNFIEDQGACIGKQGCETFCAPPKAVVYKGQPRSPDDLNEQLKQGTDLSNQLVCGCDSPGTNLKPCDKNFDGNFNGQCINNACAEGQVDS